MTQLLTEQWTYEKYLTLPDDGKRYEIIEGELFVSPAPITDHQHVSSEIEWHLQQFVRPQGLGVVYHAPYEVHLPNTTTIVQPDVLFIRSENAPKAGTPYFVGVPDLVIEIISPSSDRTDRYVKFGVYEKAGVPEYWVVDPQVRYVTVYTLQEEEYKVLVKAVGNEMITLQVLAGLEIRNSSLFL